MGFRSGCMGVGLGKDVWVLVRMFGFGWGCLGLGRDVWVWIA